MDVEFDRDFRFADTHVATGTGRVQDTWDEELLAHVRTLVEEDLKGKRAKEKSGGKQKDFLPSESQKRTVLNVMLSRRTARDEHLCSVVRLLRGIRGDLKVP